MGSSLSLDVRANPVLRAAILAMKSVDRAVQKQVRQHVKAIASPEWREAIDRRASSQLERRVIAATATVAVSNLNVRVQSAMKGRPLSGGLDPRVDYPAVEFGADPRSLLIYTRRARGVGARKRVRRTLGGGFPARRAEGPFYGAGREMIPRIASMYVQTVVRTIGDALRGKGG